MGRALGLSPLKSAYRQHWLQPLANCTHIQFVFFFSDTEMVIQGGKRTFPRLYRKEKAFDDNEEVALALLLSA